MIPSKFSVKNLHKFSSLISQLRNSTNHSQSYKIQFASVRDVRPTVKFIQENFFDDEPLSKSLKITKKSLNDSMEIFIEDSIKQGLTLLAKMNDHEIIGASINARNCEFDSKKLIEFASCSLCSETKKLFFIWSLLAQENSIIHQKFSELCLFEIRMLSVRRDFQRKGIGSELVKRSLDLARDSNFNFAIMNCTNKFAKRIAEKESMEEIWNASYTNILSDNKPIAIPEHPHSSASVSFINLKA